jgi:hypothetical protein
MGGVAGTKKASCLPSIAPIQLGLVEKESARLQLRAIPGPIDYHRAEPASTRKRPGSAARPSGAEWPVGPDERQGQVNGRRAERYPRKLPVVIKADRRRGQSGLPDAGAGVRPIQRVAMSLEGV